MLGNVQKSLDGNKSVIRQVTLILYDTLDPPFHASKHVQTIHQGGTQDPKPEDQSNALTTRTSLPNLKVLQPSPSLAQVPENLRKQRPGNLQLPQKTSDPERSERRGRYATAETWNDHCTRPWAAHQMNRPWT